MAVYVARVGADAIRIYPVDGSPHDQPVDTIRLPEAGTLRQVLRENGWEPTGQRGPGGSWGAIYVVPIRPGRPAS